MKTTVCSKDNCNGCMACYDICPKDAVSIVDSISAYNAVIDENKCINCGLCSKVCPRNNPVELNSPKYWFQGWAEDKEIRNTSSSGGVAAALENEFVKNIGIVYSCTFQKGEFCFEKAVTTDDVKKFRGSMYVKSNPKGVYKNVKEDLKNGKSVLFLGLPCQVAAMKNSIPENLKQNLYTVDLICHGSPSPEILKTYFKQHDLSLEKAEMCRFRKKTKFQLHYNDKPIGYRGTVDGYMICFLNGLFYTENCYNCNYARLERPSDITLGDSWGSELSEKEPNGISLIICQTEKGYKLLKSSSVRLLPVDIETAVNNNHQLRHPSVKPAEYLKFMSGFSKKKSIDKMCMKIYPKQYLKQCIKSIIYRINKN